MNKQHIFAAHLEDNLSMAIELVVILYTTSFITLLYWFIPLFAILRHRQKDKNSAPVSVIVCAHNEYSNLKKLIPKLTSQNHAAGYEIIIVDDRSSDESYDLLLNLKSKKIKCVRIDQVHNHINAKKYAITLGIKAANNEIILLTDADCLPSDDNWITKMTQGMSEDTSFSIGISPYLKKAGFLNQFIRFETIQTAFNYIGIGLLGNPYMGVGRNLAYRKSVFLNNNGFHDIKHIVGGDDDLIVNKLATKHNTNFALDASSRTYSLPKENLISFFKQKIRHLSVSKYYKTHDKIILGIQSLNNLLFWITLLILSFLTKNYIFLIIVLLLRWVVLMIVHYLSAKRIGDSNSLYLIPVLDFSYLLYTVVFGSIAMFTSKIRWK